MKNLIIALLSLALFAGCKKDVHACKEYTELIGREPAANAANAPELLDTLAKYPQLQLYRFYSDNYSWNATCHVYYGDLPIFSDYYFLSKSTVTGKLSSQDSVFTGPLTISLEPAVSAKDAIKEAKKLQNFDHTCISYRLGLFNLAYGGGRNYRLVWRIEGKDGNPFVTVNAVDKSIVQSGTTAILF